MKNDVLKNQIHLRLALMKYEVVKAEEIGNLITLAFTVGLIIGCFQNNNTKPFN